MLTVIASKGVPHRMAALLAAALLFAAGLSLPFPAMAQTTSWDQVMQLSDSDFGGLAASKDGIWAVTRGDPFLLHSADGVSWSFVSSLQQSKESALTLAVLPGTGTLLVGCSNGIYRSTNNGNTWARTGGSSMVRGFLAVGSRVFAATEYGIVLSENDGGIWDTAGLYGQRVHALAYTGGYYLAATENGVYRRHQTQYWPTTPAAFSQRQILDLAVDGEGLVFAAGDLSPNYIYYSSDQGISWLNLFDANRQAAVSELAVSPDGRLFSASPGSSYLPSKRRPAFPWEDTNFQNAVPAGVFIIRDLLVDQEAGFAYVCGRDAQNTSRILRSRESTLESPASLRILQQPPGTAVSLWSLSPPATVGVHDSYGVLLRRGGRSVGAELRGGTAGATLSGGTQAVTAADGVASFGNLRIDKAGTGYRLIFSSPGLTSDTSDAVRIVHGAAAEFKFTQYPSGGTAGKRLETFVAEMRDSSGNLTVNINPSVRLSIAQGPAGAKIDNSSTTVVTLTNGQAWWTDIIVDRAGDYAFGAQSSQLYDITPAIPITSGQIPAALRFTMEPLNVVAGEAFSVAVEIVDDAGGRILTDTRTVTLRLGSNPESATLSGTVSRAASGGYAEFTGLTMDLEGTGYTLVAEAAGLRADTTAAFDVQPGPPARLEIVSSVPDVLADEAFELDVLVLDREGNVTGSAPPQVTLALEGGTPGAVLGGQTSRVIPGSGTFTGLSVDRQGNGYLLIATAPSLTADTSNVFDVLSPQASRLLFQTQPGGGGADDPLSRQPVVIVVDHDGTPVPVNDLDVTLSILHNPGGAQLEGSSTVTTAGGTAAFTGLAVRAAAQGYTLLASAAGVVGDTSTAFDITHGQAEQLRFHAQPGDADAGALIPAPVLRVLDHWENTVTSSNTRIAMEIGSNPANGTLSGTTERNASLGEATFDDLRIDRTGSGYTLKATAAGLLEAVSDPFDIRSSGTPVRVAFELQPEGGRADRPLSVQPVVVVLDASGSVVQGSSAQVEVDILPSATGASLDGVRFKAAEQGIAVFSGLEVRTVGQGYRLVTRSTGLASDTSAAFDIVAGAPAHLGFITQPTNAARSQTITPAVTVGVYDAADNLVDSSSAWIAVALDSNPGGAGLLGTALRRASSGIASFDDLAVDRAGQGYTLKASAAGLYDDVSSAFDVLDTERTMSMHAGDQQNGSVGTQLSAPLAVIVRDGGGLPVADVPVQFTITEQPAGATGSVVLPSLPATGPDGIAATQLTLGSRTGSYVIEAAASGVAGSPQRFTATATPPPYPATIALQHAWSFPTHEDKGAYRPTDYRIIGLPGNGDFDIATLLSGAQNEHWKLFRDTGGDGEPSEYLQPYDGGAEFRAGTGRAFWLLHRGDVAVDRTVASAPVNGGREAELPLQDGWNLISSPFPGVLPWSVVTAVNGISDPIFCYDGVRGTSADIEPYVGYYYFNRDGRSALRIPYDSIYAPRLTVARGPGWLVDILLETGELRDRSLSFGMLPDAENAFDRRDYPVPRGLGGMLSASFPHPEWERAFMRCGRDVRASATLPQEWELELESPDARAVTLTFGNIDGIDPSVDVLLIDEQTHERFSLRRQSSYTVFLRSAPYRLRLQAMARDGREPPGNAAASGLQLSPPYPNPAYDGCNVAVVLPQEGMTQVSVRDMLGRTVHRLHDGLLPSGRHIMYWNGSNSDGAPLPAGTYFIHVHSTGTPAVSVPVVILSR